MKSVTSSFSLCTFKKKSETYKPHRPYGSVFVFFMYILMLLPLGSCATSQDSLIVDSGNAIYDPYEEYNRTVTSFNLLVDHTIINPVLKGYRTVTPEPARTGLQNVMKNLRSPVNLLNQILQGDFAGAHDVLVRAVVNTTIGVGGIFDVAGYEGIPYESEDFGQTLAVWGVGSGPYLVVPFIGASSLRDYGGVAVDSFADPLRWYTHNTDKEGLYYAKLGTEYLLLRDSMSDTMSELERSSFDYYAALRSTYYQYRKAAILDSAHYNNVGRYEDLPDIPDFDEE